MKYIFREMSLLSVHFLKDLSSVQIVAEKALWVLGIVFQFLSIKKPSE